MKKVYCRECRCYFKPSLGLRPFVVVPAFIRCHTGHELETNFEIRCEITARRLFSLALALTGIVALPLAISKAGIFVGLIVGSLATLMVGGAIGVALYYLAAVPLQAVLEAGRSVGKAISKTKRSSTSNEEERLRRFIDDK